MPRIISTDWDLDARMRRDLNSSADEGGYHKLPELEETEARGFRTRKTIISAKGADGKIRYFGGKAATISATTAEMGRVLGIPEALPVAEVADSPEGESVKTETPAVAPKAKAKSK